MTGLRERKHEQARAAIIAAAFTLFSESGFEATTTAQIAETADVSPRTLYRHFPTKDAIVFAGNEDRVAAAAERIREAPADADPTTVLLDALTAGRADLARDPMTALRLRLIEETPAVAGRAYRLQAEAERTLAAELAAAYPHAVDETDAVALVGALVGAITALARRGITDPHDPRATAAARKAVAATRTQAASTTAK